MVWIERDHLIFTLQPLCLLSTGPCCSNPIQSGLKCFQGWGNHNYFFILCSSQCIYECFNAWPLIYFNGIQLQSTFFSPHVCFWEKIMLSENNFFLYISFIMQAVTEKKSLYTSKRHHTNRTDQILYELFLQLMRNQWF